MLMYKSNDVRVPRYIVVHDCKGTVFLDPVWFVAHFYGRIMSNPLEDLTTVWGKEPNSMSSSADDSVTLEITIWSSSEPISIERCWLSLQHRIHQAIAPGQWTQRYIIHSPHRPWTLRMTCSTLEGFSTFSLVAPRALTVGGTLVVTSPPVLRTLDAFQLYTLSESAERLIKALTRRSLTQSLLTLTVPKTSRYATAIFTLNPAMLSELK
jgi:hypothetical protein